MTGLMALNATPSPGLPQLQTRFAPLNQFALQQQASNYAPPAEAFAPSMQTPDAGAALAALQSQMRGPAVSKGGLGVLGQTLSNAVMGSPLGPLLSHLTGQPPYLGQMPQFAPVNLGTPTIVPPLGGPGDLRLPLGEPTGLLG